MSHCQQTVIRKSIRLSSVSAYEIKMIFDRGRFRLEVSLRKYSLKQLNKNTQKSHGRQF